MLRQQSRTHVRRFEAPQPHPDQFEIGFNGQVPDRALTRPERFEKFHRENPQFYVDLTTLARRFRDRTGRECGIQRLVEIVRFDLEMQSRTDEEFKVNNDFAAFYARLIMLREPDLAGFFQVRNSYEADQWIARLAAGVAS